MLRRSKTKNQVVSLKESVDSATSILKTPRILEMCLDLGLFYCSLNKEVLLKTCNDSIDI